MLFFWRPFTCLLTITYSGGYCVDGRMYEIFQIQIFQGFIYNHLYIHIHHTGHIVSIHIRELHRFLKQVNNYWLGIFLYIIFFVVIMDVVRLILKRIRTVGNVFLGSRKVFVTIGAITAALIIATSIHGIFHAKRIYTTSFDVSVDKACQAGDSF